MAYETQSEKKKKSFKDHTQAFIDTITGYGGQTQAEKAGELAERQQDWNEEFSQNQFDEQKRQFEKSQEMAQANLDYQKEYAEKNYQAQQEAFLYQKQENDLMREREDTSFQRQVKDLTAAGLSPLAVSGGASAQSGNVVSAPQYDTSGVSSAQGNLLALQQQYAELMNVAQGNYANRRQQAVNQRIAAKQVLAEQYERNRTYGMQFSSQLFNQAMALKDYDLRKRQADQQIAYSKSQMDWYGVHGFRNDKLWNILTPLLDTVAENLGIDYEALGKALSNLNFNFDVSLSKLEEMYDGTEEGFQKLKNTVDVLKGANIKKDSYDDMISALTEFTDTNVEQRKSWYYGMNEKFRDKYSYDDFEKAIRHTNKWLTSAILKYILFGTSGNI